MSSENPRFSYMLENKRFPDKHRYFFNSEKSRTSSERANCKVKSQKFSKKFKGFSEQYFHRYANFLFVIFLAQLINYENM